MGIIVSQSAKNLTTTYLGFGIGAINTLFLYTNFLTPEYYGLVGFLLSASNLIWPLMAFGVHNTLVKFYSSYDSREEKDKLLSVILLLPLGISLILGIIGFFAYDQLLDYFSDGEGIGETLHLAHIYNSAWRLPILKFSSPGQKCIIKVFSGIL